ncbi:ABC transporter permease [Myceligenerans indicum]|uniref:ABC transporter permease n=1 Tax=Myceligenerans indicum TaxID=2593663 RepID=A0ABS1LGB0_9MICO|nr:ABC transporter permease [Myceligenerans indicum]MBL0885247.1 ABC transporter permease [Myceligenerans indicum]
MTTVTSQPVRLVGRSWKTPIACGLFTVLATVLFIGQGRPGETTFQLSRDADLVQLPPLVAPVGATTLGLTVVLLLLTAHAVWLAVTRRRPQIWSSLAFAVAFLVAFLTWAAAGQTLPVLGLLVGTVGISVPLVFGALGGVISERVGVINVAIEGQLLGGAFVSAVVASLTGNLYAGLLGAVVAGVFVSLVLAVFSIRYWVDQVIVGVVLIVFVTGLTSFLSSTVLTKDAAALNSPPRFPAIDVPVLSQIPIIGPTFFRQTVIVYAAYVAVVVVYMCLFHTKWGLRVRAAGEHPQAADTVGIKVNAMRLWAVSIAGAVVGIGGAYFTLGAVGSFQQNMTAGMGYIALAAVIFGRWHPIRATLAALLFGFATNLQYVLGAIGSPVPSEFMLMLPYLVTIVAVAGLAGQVRKPAASGLPYARR